MHYEASVCLCSGADHLKTQVLAGIVPAAADQRGFLPVWSVKKAQDVNYDLQQEMEM